MAVCGDGVAAVVLCSTASKLAVCSEASNRVVGLNYSAVYHVVHYMNCPCHECSYRLVQRIMQILSFVCLYIQQ
jgi:hypothetical protein